MKRILFVCHGNICRSPMAEYVMKDMVKKAGMDAVFEIASAATSDEESGNGVYPPVKRLLEEAGIECRSHRARQITTEDFRHYDLIVAMDKMNLRNIGRFLGMYGIEDIGRGWPSLSSGIQEKDIAGKVRLLLSYTGKDEEIADPWYTRDFKLTWEQINEGCRALLEWCAKN